MGIITYFSGSALVLMIHLWWAVQILVAKINSEEGILGRQSKLIPREAGSTDMTVEN